LVNNFFLILLYNYFFKGDEQCVRARFNADSERNLTMNDYGCLVDWAGPKKANVGMGFVCKTAQESPDMIEERNKIIEREIAEFEEEDMPDLMYINSFILKREGRGNLMTNELSKQEGTYGLFNRVYDSNNRPQKINKRDVWQSGNFFTLTSLSLNITIINH